MYKKKSFGNFVLLALEKAVDGTVRLNDFVQNSYYVSGSGWEYTLKKSELARVIKRLREKGLIDFIDDEKLVIRITDMGKEKAILVKLAENDDKWDGRWRIVLFDIPEKRRAIRDLLRNKLKTWDFIHLQKSVWASKKNCTNELRNFVKQIGIGDWVQVIESDNVDF